MAYDVDRKPATWVMARSLRRERRMWGAAGVTAMLGVLPFLIHSLWPVIVVATVALLLVTRPYGDRHLRMLRGAVAERDVGETLDRLRDERWVVMHDIKPPRGANLDHLVSGPNGVYLIETKHLGYRDSALGRAKGQARELRHELGVWVTPVICIDAHRERPFRHKKVWVVPHAQLLTWLRRQHTDQSTSSGSRVTPTSSKSQAPSRRHG
jgi:hypothetical protein